MNISSAITYQLTIQLSSIARIEIGKLGIFDYLLAAPEVELLGVERFTQAECELNQQTSGQVLIAGFGASDCRNGCGSHLKLIGE